MKYFKHIPSLNIKILDIEHALREQIELDVEDDDHKFCLQQKQRLLKKFIVYRICDFLMKVLEQPNSTGTKLLLYIPSTLNLKFLNDYSPFIKNTFLRISKILSLSLHTANVSAYEFARLLQNKDGEGKEARARISFIFNRNLKRPNLDKFSKFLLKNGISKIEGDIANNYKVKLGLFIT